MADAAYRTPILPATTNRTRKRATHPTEKRQTGSLYEVSHITGRNTVSDDATRDRVTEDSPARETPHLPHTSQILQRHLEPRAPTQ
jgi:hypothetical protein